MKKCFKILELIKKTFNVLMIYTIVFSLVQIPMDSKVYAAGGFGPAEIQGFANQALGMYSSYIGQKQQIMQAQINAANNQRLMSQLSPTCRKPDGTACYATAGTMFPECTLPASMATMPVNTCPTTPQPPDKISSMITYESIAQGWMNYYDQMKNEAANGNYPVGISCLNAKQKAIDSQITEMINNIQRLQDRLKQDSQIFRDNNKARLEHMDLYNDELFGSSKNNNIKIKTQDFANYFSPSCQTVIGKDNLNAGSRNGLSGILQGLSSSNKAAYDFNLNRNVTVNELNQEATVISNLIKANGIDDFLNNGNSQGYIKSGSYPAIEEVVKKEAATLQTARARINKELSELGYTPKTLDNNFSDDTATFMTTANDFFEKQYVNDCVTGADNGAAIPIADILKNLKVDTRQSLTATDHAAASNYSQKVKSTLERTDIGMNEKLDIIRTIPSAPMTISYSTKGGSRVSSSPYDLFMTIVENCKSRFKNDNKSANGVTYAKKVERGRAALQELKNLNDSFASKVTHSINERIINCDGKSAKSGSVCNENSLQTTNVNFCVNQATICSNNIRGCYAEANAQVQSRKEKIVQGANKFNADVATMITRSNALYEQQKAAVTNMTQLIQSKFPGTNFEIPKDMVVSIPELSKDNAFGVPMAGNGDMKSFLEGENSMPGKLDKLMTVFRSQREKVKEETTNYINLQKTAMDTQRGRWEELNNECKTAIDTSTQAIQKANAEGLKQQAETDGKTGKFCRMYNSISQNPVGGCGKAKDLADTMDEVAGRLSPQAIDLSEKYASACDGFGNQNDDLPSTCGKAKSEQSTDEQTFCANKMKEMASKSGASSGASAASKAKKITYYSLCGTGDKTDKEFIETVSKKLAVDDQAKLKDLTTLDEVLKKSDEIDDADFFAELAPLLSKGEESICTKLKQNASADQDLDSVAIEKSFKTKIDEQNTIKKDLEVKIADKDTPSGDKQNLYNLKQAATDKAASLTTQQDTEVSKSTNNKNFKTLLVNLANIMLPPDPRGEDTKISVIQNIGEQMTGPCDMQNNSSIAKAPGFDLQKFDASILGSTR